MRLRAEPVPREAGGDAVKIAYDEHATICLVIGVVIGFTFGAGTVALMWWVS